MMKMFFIVTISWNKTTPSIVKISENGGDVLNSSSQLFHNSVLLMKMMSSQYFRSPYFNTKYVTIPNKVVGKQVPVLNCPLISLGASHFGNSHWCHGASHFGNAASITVLVPIGTRCCACTQLLSYVTKLIIQRLVITRTILFHWFDFQSL